MSRKRKDLIKKNWKHLLDCFSEGIYLTDPQGRTLGVNKAYEQITGLKEGELLGRYMDDIVAEGRLSVSITSEIVRTGNEKTIEQYTKDGRCLVICGKPIRNERGEIVLVMTAVRDMSAIDKLQSELEKFRKLAEEYREQLHLQENGVQFVAKSEAFQKAVALAHKVSNVDSTVLILGESGTGKEIIAREIHEHSYRAKEKFIKINCGAIPESLLESELFGYEKGAFTGASSKGHIGVFETASKGTVFLDEIGDMPFILQVKLLRVLQEKVVTRIGSSKPTSVNTRIIAATNEDIEKMVSEKRFRKDLYFRLNVVQIHTPPLRHRKEEIPALVDFFIAKVNKRYNLSKKLHPDVVKTLMEYDWPGNVRELENAVERMLVTSNQDYIQADMPIAYTSNIEGAKSELVFSGIMPLQAANDKLERYLLEEAAKKYKTTYEIADVLGISQPSVSRKMKKFRP